MLGPAVTFAAIGTQWRIETPTPISPDLMEQVTVLVESFDATYSRFRADSLVTDINRRPGRFTFPDEAVELFGLYRRLYRATSGAITPLVGSTLEHLGYDADYSLIRRPGPAPTIPSWSQAVTLDGSVLTTSRPLLLDFGAAGKGFLVDLVAGLLRTSGIEQFVVDASGDLLHRGRPAERVGLEDPMQPGRVIGALEVSDQALCASSTARRTWGAGLHHVIDPATREPVRGVVASWVTSDSCAVADGLATALFLVEPETLRRHFDFSYVRLHADGHADWSDELALELFR